jgi:hypothetical protein
LECRILIDATSIFVRDALHRLSAFVDLAHCAFEVVGVAINKLRGSSVEKRLAVR